MKEHLGYSTDLFSETACNFSAFQLSVDLKEDFTLIKSSLVHLHSDSDLPIFHSINDFCHSFIIASNLFQKRCDRIKKEKSKKKKTFLVPSPARNVSAFLFLLLDSSSTLQAPSSDTASSPKILLIQLRFITFQWATKSRQLLSKIRASNDYM